MSASRGARRWPMWLLACVLAASLAAPPDAGARARGEAPIARFVSTSGIPHLDLADLKMRRAGRGWDPGDPRGINANYREVMTNLLAAIAAESPDAVFHQGDMVGGRWSRDDDHTGIFGPARTVAERKRMVAAAADAYYGQTIDFWRSAGIPMWRFHAGLGDHEIGGVPADGQIGGGAWPFRAHDRFVRSWAEKFTGAGTRYRLHPRGQHAATAYAKKLVGNVLLISLDPFQRQRYEMVATVAGAQKRWLFRMVHSHPRAHVFIQSEIPAIGPNCARATSAVRLANGPRLWRQLAREPNVELFLTAEYHAVTTYSADGREPVQIVHGGNLLRGVGANWLVIDRYEDRTELTVKHWGVDALETDKRLWQLQENARPPRFIQLRPAPKVVGTMTISADGAIVAQSGALAEGPQDGEPGCQEPRRAG